MTLEGAFWGSEVAIFGAGGMDDWAFVTALTSFLCQSIRGFVKAAYLRNENKDNLLKPENINNKISDHRVSKTTHALPDLMSFWKSMEAPNIDKGNLFFNL